MIDIDGSLHSGSGTIVRHAAAYAALTGQPVRVRNARAQRQRPGLSPSTWGDPGDTRPGGPEPRRSRGGIPVLRVLAGNAEPAGRYAWDIGIAGSPTTLAVSVLPVLTFCGRGAEASSAAACSRTFAPSGLHLRHVIVRMLTEMGLAAGIEMIRPAYPPAGQGILRLAVPACERSLRPLTPAAARHPHGSGELPWHPTWMTGTSRPGWPPPPPRSSARPGSAPSLLDIARQPGPRSRQRFASARAIPAAGTVLRLLPRITASVQAGPFAPLRSRLTFGPPVWDLSI